MYLFKIHQQSIGTHYSRSLFLTTVVPYFGSGLTFFHCLKPTVLSTHQSSPNQLYLLLIVFSKRDCMTLNVMTFSTRTCTQSSANFEKNNFQFLGKTRTSNSRRKKQRKVSGIEPAHLPPPAQCLTMQLTVHIKALSSCRCENYTTRAPHRSLCMLQVAKLSCGKTGLQVLRYLH